MENNNLPEMTDEQRKAALERAAEACRERTEFKGLVKTGEISLADALADDRAKRIRVHEFLMCIPGIGKAKADDIMRKLGIAENRRVQGLGSRQREGIVELVAKLKWEYGAARVGGFPYQPSATKGDAIWTSARTR